MATQLQILNRLQRRLREDETSTSSLTDYSTLLSEFVADAYLEVADAHMWETFKHLVRVDVVSGTSKYELTANVASSGDVRDGDTPCKMDSELQWLDSNLPEVQFFDSDSDIDDNGLWYMTPEAFRRKKSMDRTDTNINPLFFTIYQENDGVDTKLFLEIYPEPAASRVFEARFWTMPTELEVDDSTDAQLLLVPDRPILMLALMYALNERGEEIGEPGNLAERRFILALGVAIDRDIAASQRGDRYDWKRD